MSITIRDIDGAPVPLNTDDVEGILRSSLFGRIDGYEVIGITFWSKSSTCEVTVRKEQP